MSRGYEVQARGTFADKTHALCIVILFVASITLVIASSCVLSTSPLGAGDDVYYVQGKLVKVLPDRDFVLQISAGAQLQFRCSISCRASLGHLLRHLREHASTDVYYERGADNVFFARYVD